MKKLLVLLLVCGMATMASAALEWTIAGATGPDGKVNPGDALTLSLMSDVGVTGLRIGQLTDNGYVGGAFVSSSVNASLDSVTSTGLTVADFDALLGSFGMDPTGLPLQDLAFVDVAATSKAATGAIFTVLYDVLVDAPAQIVNVDAVALTSVPGFALGAQVDTLEALNTAIPALSFEVVPEPMTMALLGLGGLFLRRRK